MKSPPTIRQKVDASKRYVIYSPPTILTIHFKRFEQTHTGTRSSFKKVRGHIQFPLKLDLASFCSRYNPVTSKTSYKEHLLENFIGPEAHMVQPLWHSFALWRLKFRPLHFLRSKTPRDAPSSNVY